MANHSYVFGCGARTAPTYEDSKKLTYGEIVETRACAVQVTEAGNLNVQLVGHPHVGTNWMKILVSTMLFFATNYDEQPFFANLASDRTITHNITFHSLTYRGYFKHNIPYFPHSGQDGWVPLKGNLSSAISPCKYMAWKDVKETCIQPISANLVLPVHLQTRWLLLMRNPISLCISNAHHSPSSFDVCSYQIDALALLAIVRFLWHSEVLPSEATFTWWYEDDGYSQCREFLRFLGYRSDLGVLCEPAVNLNSRAARAAVMGLSSNRGHNSRLKHSVNVLVDDIELALSPQQAANLTQRFWDRLPPLMQGKWVYTLRKYLL